MTIPESRYDGDEHRQSWYSDCDDAYTGCAMPIGQKADFWREYFATNLHERIQYRSVLDCILRDFAAVEAHCLRLTPSLEDVRTEAEFEAWMGMPFHELIGLAQANALGPVSWRARLGVWRGRVRYWWRTGEWR